jgi:hypothetical protein
MGVPQEERRTESKTLKERSFALRRFWQSDIIKGNA